MCLVTRGRWDAIRAVALAGVILSHDVAAASPADPQPAGPWTFELGGGVFREAWNYNLSDEDLGGATFTWLRTIRGPWSAGIEGLLIGVHQERVPSTMVEGFSTIIRWQHRRHNATYFWNIGVGYSYAGSEVPQRGTRANYIAQAGGGVILPVGTTTRLVGELLWLHLSNNSLAGRDRNPDIQALGLRVAMAVPLSRSRAEPGRSEAQPR